jgi:hypothetical protein
MGSLPDAKKGKLFLRKPLDAPWLFGWLHGAADLHSITGHIRKNRLLTLYRIAFVYR